jgi:uncharacterized membrane protein YcaP (DUF421 family)
LADGTPVIIVENGHWHHERMWRMRLQDQDVMAAARDKGIRTLEQIDMAIVERDGSISVFATGSGQKKNSSGDQNQNGERSGEAA